MERSLRPAEAGEREEAGGGPEGSWWRDRAAKEREAAARANGGSAAFVLKDGPRTVEAPHRLVCQLPSGLPPLPHLDAALPLYERLRHRERDNLYETDRGSEDLQDRVTHNSCR